MTGGKPKHGDRHTPAEERRLRRIPQPTNVSSSMPELCTCVVCGEPYFATDGRSWHPACHEPESPAEMLGAIGSAMTKLGAEIISIEDTK